MERRYQAELISGQRPYFNYYGELLLANRYDKSAWVGDMGNMAEKWTCHGPV
jgi:hypothetical protein